MTIAKKPWNWDKATLAFRKHHEQGMPKRYRRASFRQIKAAQKQAASDHRAMYCTRLALTIRSIHYRSVCEDAEVQYYGHS